MNDILREQQDYYRARAAEYDQWFLRQGRYDRGEAHRNEWFNEIQIVQDSLRDCLRGGDVLEIACGTGLWTQRLASTHSRVVAIDSSPEAIEINRGRVKNGRVEYIVADVFDWVPKGRFDAVFFGFWLSHVPDDKFNGFWEKVSASLKPGGRVFLVDSLLEQDSTAVDHARIDSSGVVSRLLNDGRSFRIVKIFHEPEVLLRRLEERGWHGWIRPAGRFFLYGCVGMS